MSHEAVDHHCWIARVLGWSAVLSVTLLLLPAPGCLFTLIGGDCGLILTIQGRLVDTDSATPVSGAIVGNCIFYEDGLGDDCVPLTCGGGPCWPPSMDDGTFSVSRSTLGGCPPPPYRTPDRIEITVLRDTCETTYSIDVNDDTVDDLGTTDQDEGAASNHTIELKEPILVPPCEEETVP